MLDMLVIGAADDDVCRGRMAGRMYVADAAARGFQPFDGLGGAELYARLPGDILKRFGNFAETTYG